MQVLFDKNVPYGLRRFLTGHTVETAGEKGWGNLFNGRLLTAAEEQGFDVTVTADQNFCYQQNLKDRRIAIVALGTNLWPVIKPCASEIATLVDAAQPGGYYFLDFPAAHKRKQTQRPMRDL